MTSTVWVKEHVNAFESCERACDILLHTRTKYQELLIVRSPALGLGMLLDGKWQLSEADEFIYHETLAHPPLILHGHPACVAVLGGGDGGTAREVLSWPGVEQAGWNICDAERPALAYDGATVQAGLRRCPLRL